MYYLYVNYPNNFVRRHSNSSCPTIKMHQKEGQRSIAIDNNNIEQKLNELKNGISFASTAELNDLWIEVGISDSLQAVRIVGSIKNALGENNDRFKSLELLHCQQCGD